MYVLQGEYPNNWRRWISGSAAKTTWQQWRDEVQVSDKDRSRGDECSTRNGSYICQIDIDIETVPDVHVAVFEL